MQTEKKKLEWLDYDSLEDHPSIIGRTFLRHGGASIGAFSTLNISDAVGDHPDSVKVNRSLILNSIGVSHLAFAKQKHGDNVVKVTLDNYSKLPEADGIYTRESDIGLVVTHADCQAAIFYDPVNQIIGAVHAGWRGLVQKDVYKSMVDTFVQEGSNLEDIIVCVSPSLGPEHSEFKNYKTEIPKEFWDFQIRPFYFDLWKIARFRLSEAGILEGNIELAEICTFSNPKDYFSYRRDKITGRHGTVIAIKK